MDWIILAQVRDKWWTLVNSVVNKRVPYNSGNSWTIVLLLPCHEGLFSIDSDSCKTFLEFSIADSLDQRATKWAMAPNCA